MSNEVQVLMNVDILGQTATIYGDAYDPLFLAKDVAEWIGYDQSSVTKMIANVDDDEKLIGTIFREGQGRPLALLTENGVYEVLMQSRKPLAKDFKRKVKEILHEIRVTGSYSVVSADQQREAMKQQLMRELSIAPRKDACNALDEARHVSEKPKPLRGYCYGNFTNAIYRALFNMKASEIKSLLHVGKKHSLRDKFTAFELETVVKAEQKADELLRGTGGDRLTDAQLQRILEVLFQKIDIVHNHTLPEVCP